MISFHVYGLHVVSAVWIYNGLSAKEMEQLIVLNRKRMISALVNDIEHIESASYKQCREGIPPARHSRFGHRGTDNGQRTGGIALAAARRKLAGILFYNASSAPLLQCSPAGKKSSPFSGIVTVRNVDVGDIFVAASGRALFHMAQMQTMRIRVQIPQNMARSISPGQWTEMSIATPPGVPSGAKGYGRRELLPHFCPVGG